MNAPKTLEPDLSGQTLERYRLIRRMGMGGMGAVYEAEHTKLEKRVAVKVLRQEFTQQEIARKRFLREAKAATRVKHPNVVDISDFGETDEGLVFFVMELLVGRDLSDLIKADKQLSWERTQKILLQVVSALDAAHAQGIVHRDMKPSNCFLVEGPGMEGTDFIKVLDFGIAKITRKVGEETEGLTSTDEVFGTVAYMAPEMALGTSDDPRSDIYAVGVMMYRMLTGELPFSEGNAFQILAQHINARIPAPRSKEPSIPVEIEAILFKALEKRPEDRFQTMAQLAGALRQGALPQGPQPDEEATMVALPFASASALTAPAYVPSGVMATMPLVPETIVAIPPASAPASAPRPAKETKSSPMRLALLAVVTIGVVASSVVLGVFLAGNTGEESAPVMASAPAIADPEPEAKVDVVTPTPGEDESAARAGPEPVEVPVAPPEPKVEDPDATETPIEAPVEPATIKKKTTTTTVGTKPPKTDDKVIESLEKKILAECKQDGTVRVRLEGLIYDDGRIQGALATPKAGPGTCAVRILKSARFAPRDGMKPMPMFSVDL